MLLCSDGSYYTGHTDVIDTRWGQHRAGEGSQYTKSRLPVKLVWVGNFPTREQAKDFELKLKKWNSARKRPWLTAMMTRCWKQLKNTGGKLTE